MLTPLLPGQPMLPNFLIEYIQRSKLARFVPSKFRPLLRNLVSTTYAERVAREQAIFAGQVVVHDLPPIFHYWSNTWLRPQFEALGFSDPDRFFVEYLKRAIADHPDRPVRFASLGAGNCDTEIRVARALVEAGLDRFTLECVDINPAMLERGRAAAREQGLEAQVLPVEGDFNAWRPSGRYEAIMANQSLHHVLALENLFGAIESALTDDGRFVVSDMIGRNGHMRWPEAMAIVHEYWRELPPAYRWNVQLRRHEELLEYWDCSKEGFEGIRAQDILPLLIERFDFETFYAYGNLIDPFIDRSFGPHFDADSADDRALIDRIHERDVAEIAAGNIKPTHLIAVLRKRPYEGPMAHLPGITPTSSVRVVP
jgi:SAM-dependent methyltransferase